MATRYTGRLDRLQRTLRDQSAGLAVLAPSDQMRYLIGWADGGHERLVALFVPAAGDPAIVAPAINAQSAEANPGGVRRVVGWADDSGWARGVAELIAGWEIAETATVVIDDELLSSHLLGLQELFPRMRYVPAARTMAALRSAKSADELEAMGRAAALIDEVYEESLSALCVGLTETEMQQVILDGIKRRSSMPSFTPLICFGANGAMPHHNSDATPLRRGDVVVIDIGCTYGGYASDITRTVSFGAPGDADAQHVYSTVFRAHHAARRMAAPGVRAEAVDAAARTIIEEAGYGPQFFHRTGHGIGVSVHEAPYIVRGNNEPLQPGNCFSVEPGIYLPGRLGVRIENIVTVTQDGCRSLNAEPSAELTII